MKISIVLLAIALTVVGVPLAAADETDPDCEAGQPGIGYRTLAVVWDSVGSKPICEGEHWDGQDPINSGSTSCSATVDPEQLLVGVCLEQDPNTMSGEDAANPVGLRVSSDGEDEVYTAANIVLVGRAVVYVGPDMAAVYLRDNTPGNVLATVVSTARITQGYVSENDCDQAVYQEGAQTQTPLCGRDNTAITVLFPALA